MGFLDWIGKRFTKKKVAPALIGHDDGVSLYVLLKGEGDSVMVMFRDTYVHTYGDIQAPNPAQSDIDNIFSTMTKVRVLAGGVSLGTPVNDELILECEDPQLLKQLSFCLAIHSRSEDQLSRCACLGGPTFECYSGDELLGRLSLQHGTSVRYDGWKYDAELKDGPGLDSWLTENGVHPGLLQLIYKNQYQGLGIRCEHQRPLSALEQTFRILENIREEQNSPELLQQTDELVKQNPDFAFGYAIRGNILKSSGSTRPALQDFNRAIELGLENSQVFYLRGLYFDKQDQLEDALNDLNNAIRIKAEHPQYLNSRGIIHRKSKRWNNALLDFNKAMALAPGWELPYLNRFPVYREIGNDQAALKDLDHLVSLSENGNGNFEDQVLSVIFFNRGQIHEKLGNPEQGRVDRQRAKELYPSMYAN